MSKQILGWIVDTPAMTISLPDHQSDRLQDVLRSFPPHEKWTSAKRWHKTLGELHSMALALPGSHNIFSSLQNALYPLSKSCISLNKGIHDVLDDFRWMHRDISTHLTCIAEIIPLLLVSEGHHNASGLGAGGVWFPGTGIIPPSDYSDNSPIV
jgi:hypothetical protein